MYLKGGVRNQTRLRIYFKVFVNTSFHCTGHYFVAFVGCANQSIEVNEGKKFVYFTLKREGFLDRASPIW
jgi:hypothetical protein